MYGLVIFIHIIVCILLIITILIQRGRGGGLVESFSGFESMFGPKTSTFLTRATSVLAVIFMCTCLILTFFSVIQSRSLMENLKIENTSISSSEIPPKGADTKPENLNPENTTKAE